MLPYACRLRPLEGQALLLHPSHTEGLLTMVQGGANRYQWDHLSIPQWVSRCLVEISLLSFSVVRIQALTLVKHIAQRTIVKNHNFAEIWFNRAQIFDERSIPICTMLAVESTRKEFPLLLQPIYDRIRVLLNRSSENNKIIPFANLGAFKLMSHHQRM